MLLASVIAFNASWFNPLWDWWGLLWNDDIFIIRNSGSSARNPVPEVDYPTQPPMMSFKAFLQTQDDSISDDDAIRKYGEYKLDFKRQQLHEFFLAHKEEEWYVHPFLHLNTCELSSLAYLLSTFYSLINHIGHHWMCSTMKDLGVVNLIWFVKWRSEVFRSQWELCSSKMSLHEGNPQNALIMQGDPSTYPQRSTQNAFIQDILYKSSIKT